MKRNLRVLLSCALLLMAFVTGAMAEEKSVTFTNEVFPVVNGQNNPFSATLDEITFACSSGITANTSSKRYTEVRLYKGSATQITAKENYLITKIEITCTASGDANYGPSKISFEEDGAYTIDGKVGTWAGTPSNSIVLTLNAQSRFTSIVVTYVTSDTPVLSQPELAWDAKDVKAYVLDGVLQTTTLPIFSKTTTADATFESDNDEVATVDAEGKITLTGKVGTAVIKASCEANDTYAAGSASTTISVAKATEIIPATHFVENAHYALIVELSTESGAKVVCAYSSESPANDAEYLPVRDVISLGDALCVEDDALYTVEQGTACYIVKNAYDKYVYQQSGKNNYSYSTDIPAENWTINDGLITNQTNSSVVYYSTQYTSFGAYTGDPKETDVVPVLYIVRSEQTEYVPSTKAEAELAFSETSLKVFKGMDYTVPTFSAKTSASVSFKSSNESVATVSAEGVITITGTAGKAIITATSPENEEYQAGSATCTITVVEAVEVIKASKVADGLHYALVVKVGDQLMSAYSNEDKNYEFLPKKEVGDNGESLFVETDAIYTFEKNGDDFAIKNAYDKYLYMDDTHNSYNYTTDLTSASNYLWSATIDAVSGEATITNIGKEKVVNYDSSYGTFGCYSTTSESYTKPTLYILKSEADRQAVRNISSEKMGNGVIYDINGRRVCASYKGLIIINGVLKLQK